MYPFAATSVRLARDFKTALSLLDTLQSNRTIVANLSSNLTRDPNLDAIPEMLQWTRKGGYEPGDFSKAGLKFIHIAGTKGKGSTCAFIESILLQYRNRENEKNRNLRDKTREGEIQKKGTDVKFLGKVGLFTSPHMITVRERIRIDGEPMSEELFTQYFFELWARFESTAMKTDPPNSPLARPGYFRFLTILAFHAFIKEGVETAIMECGIGGEYDSTNIIPAEATTVCGITSLGIDHVGMLGNTIEKIAWHKAGIMKKNVPVFTIPQKPSAMEVLQARAVEKGAILHAIPAEDTTVSGLELGIEGEYQTQNASLAIRIASSHLTSILGTQDISFTEGLKKATILGRCQTLQRKDITWYLDGAHTTESLLAAAKWYQGMTQASRSSTRILIFNQEEESSRNAGELLQNLITTLLNPSTPQTPAFTHALIPRIAKPSSSEIQQSQATPGQEILQRIISDSAFASEVSVSSSIGDAVRAIQRIANEKGKEVSVFVTGSLKLVGGVLESIEDEDKE